MNKWTLTVLFLFFCLILAVGQNYENAAVKYADALFKNKTPTERIKALKQFIIEFPDRSNLYVKLAYYQLTINSFQSGEYQAAIKYGEKRIGMGIFGEGEEARLYLALGNAYAIKKNPLYDKNKALGYTKKAMHVARVNEDDQIFGAAKQLLIKINESGVQEQSSVQRFRRSYSAENYIKAAEIYNSMTPSEKKQRDNLTAYAISLFKRGQLDEALSRFDQIYLERKTGKIAQCIAQIYSEKSLKNPNYMDQAIKKYVEAGVLFEKEREFLKRDKANQRAISQIQKKHKYKEKYDRVQQMISQQRNNSSKNNQEIRKIKSRLREIERTLRTDYADIEPPKYLSDEQERLEKKLENLESGLGDQKMGEIDKLEQLRKSIDIELANLKKEVMKQLKY